jgi:hypothetical protein
LNIKLRSRASVSRVAKILRGVRKANRCQCGTSLTLGKARAKSRTRSALTAISLPTRERFLMNAPVTLPHWVQHGAIRLSRRRNQDFCAAGRPLSTLQRSFHCCSQKVGPCPPHLPFAIVVGIGSIGWISRYSISRYSMTSVARARTDGGSASAPSSRDRPAS